MSFKGHRLNLFLSRELERGLIKLQADKDLGRSFAGLLCFVEGLYQQGYLPTELYKKYAARYSTPLNKPVARATQEKQDLEKVGQQFTKAIQNWPRMNDKARLWYLEKAEQYKGKIANADLILALASKEPVELMSHG